jgi:hypothetical protein
MKVARYRMKWAAISGIRVLGHFARVYSARFENFNTVFDNFKREIGGRIVL